MTIVFELSIIEYCYSFSYLCANIGNNSETCKKFGEYFAERMPQKKMTGKNALSFLASPWWQAKKPSGHICHHQSVCEPEALSADRQYN